MTTRSPHESDRPPAGPVHLSIHGRVQGVGFRDAFSLLALERGIDGWVRNRRDGTVEALVHGDERALTALIRWSHRGPPAARVERVDVRPASPDEAAALEPGFRRLPTA